MAFIALAGLAELSEGSLLPVEVGGRSLLLVHHHGTTHLIDNRCGHFGVPLDQGSVADGRIRCRAHGFEFDLVTGAVVDRPLENCQAVGVYAVVIRGDQVGIETTD